MQTDLRLLLLIIGLVYISYVLIKSFRRKRFNALLNQAMDEQGLSDAFPRPQYSQAGVSEQQRSFDNAQVENDPLLENMVTRVDSNKIILECETIHVVNEQQVYTNTHEEIKIQSRFESEVLRKPEITKKSPNPEFVAISIVAKGHHQLSGQKLLATLKKHHFYFGKKQLFHRHVDDDPTQPILYSVVSMTEPGAFAPHKMDQQSFAGILFLLVLPSTTATFDNMLATARQLGVILQGELLDARRQPLSTHSLEQYRRACNQD